MPRRPDRREDSVDIPGEVANLAKDAGKVILRGIGRVVSFTLAGGVVGALAGGVVGAVYGFPILTSIGVGAIAGLVLALAIMGFWVFLH